MSTKKRPDAGKSETVFRFRIPPELKVDFEAACREIDRTGSQVLRAAVREFVQARKKEAK